MEAALADIATALSTDKKHMAITVISDAGLEATIVLSAEEAETVITQIGRVRAEMEPPVIRKVEGSPVFRDVTRETVFHVNREHVMAKEFFIAARHPGFGWLAFTLVPETGLLLSNLINRQVEAITPKIIKPGSGLIV